MTDHHDDSEFVDPEDLKVQRDASGERLPETHTIEGLGRAEITPMAYGDVQEYFGDGQQADIESDVMADLFNEFYVKPDFSFAPGDIRDMKPLVPRDLLMALLEVSGIEADVMVDEAGEATVDVAEGNT